MTEILNNIFLYRSAVLRIRIRCLFDPWIQDPGSYFRELINNFWVKILKFFYADPGSGMEKIRIRDKHPGSGKLPLWYLPVCFVYKHFGV